MIYYLIASIACAVAFIALAFVTNHFQKKQDFKWVPFAVADGLALGGSVLFGLLCATS